MDSEDRRIFGKITQVDICPFGVGFIVSVGRVTLWLEVEEAEDLLHCLGRALMVEAAGDDMSEPETSSEDAESDPKSSLPIPSFRGPRKN